MRRQGYLGVVFLVSIAAAASESPKKDSKTYEAANSIQDVVAPFVKSVTRTYDKKVVRDLPPQEREPASEEGPSKDEIIHGK